MGTLKPTIRANGIDYVLVGDYYLPCIEFSKDTRPVGHFGRLHRYYLQQRHPVQYSTLILSDKLHSYLADLNEQANERYHILINQMMETEGVTESLKSSNQMLWVQSMNSIQNRAMEIIKSEMVYCD